MDSLSTNDDKEETVPTEGFSNLGSKEVHFSRQVWYPEPAKDPNFRTKVCSLYSCGFQ